MSKRALTAEDVQSFEWPSNPLLSPDGQWVVFEKMVANPKDDGYETQLMIAKVDGSGLRPLTSAGTNNSAATWSADGRVLAFVSDRTYGSQVWLIHMDGGEARRLTRFRYGMTSLVWGPDGRTLFGLVPVSKDKEVELFDTELSDKEAKEASEKESKEWAEGPKRYDWMYYKSDGVGLSKGRKQQLVSVDVETGTHRQLTSGNHNVEEPVVSPDGKYVAFVSNRKANPDTEWWYSDVYRVPAAGGDLQLLSSDVIAYQLTYSPDGKTLAIQGHGDEYGQYKSAAHLHLFTMPSEGGTVVKLTRTFPDTLGDTCLSDMRGNARNQAPVWSNDGKYIYVLSSREGRSEVVRFTPSGTGSGEVVIGGDRDVYGFACNGDAQFVISYATPIHPGQIVVVDITGVQGATRSHRAVTAPMTQTPVAFFPHAQTRLDNCNDAILNEVDLVEPEPFWFTSADDWQVQGWVMKPANYQAGQKCPVILEIHGGPQANYGYAMFHEMQWFAAQGYAIVFTNPRGGMSYGQKFVNAVRHNYGGNDAADVMNGLDAAVQQFDFLDGQRVAVTGGSYGGFMTNWLVGHTDRFFAAVSQRSISNWISFYGVSDIGPLFVESQHGGDVVHDHEMLWRISPLAYVQNVKTPLLLVHSENDLRCPIEQAEQFYTCIKRQGGEVELLRIPNASHGLSRNGKPKLRIARLHAILDYMHDRLPEA